MIGMTCLRCEKPLPLFTHAKTKYCSERCARAASRISPGVAIWNNWKSRRKAKGLPCGKRSTPSVADLVQRDGLDCHVCMEPIDYTLTWKDGDSMTIDHLIPVSDPRSFHALENLKLAHRRCNILRGNSVYNERVMV